MATRSVKQVPARRDTVWTESRRRFVLAMLFLVAVANFVDRQVISVLLEPIKKEFGASDAEMGLLTGAYFAIFYVAASLPLARLADLGNRRSLIAGCLALWSGMTALCGVSQSYWQLAMCRMGVAVGEAGSPPATHSMLADMYPVERRAGAVGLFLVGQAAGLGMGVYLGGLLGEIFGWRGVLILLGLPGIAFALIFRLTVPEPPRAIVSGQAADVEGGIIAGCARCLRIVSIRYLILIVMLLAMSGYAFLAWGPTFLIRVHGLSGKEAGMYLGAAIFIGSSLGNGFAGFLANVLVRRDPRWFFWATAFILGAAVPLALGFTLWPGAMGAAVFYALSRIFAAGFAPLLYTVATALAHPRERALMVALITTVQNLGGIALGPSLLGVANDMLAPTFGQEAVRYSLIIAVIPLALSSLLALAGVGALRRDFQRIKTDAAGRQQPTGG
jgi:predicted MFS family arabinose efflux permease